MFKGLTHNKGNIPLCVMKFGEHVGCLNIFLRITGQIVTEVQFGELAGPYSSSDINKGDLERNIGSLEDINALQSKFTSNVNR
jgi:hypothetical protein